MRRDLTATANKLQRSALKSYAQAARRISEAVAHGRQAVEKGRVAFDRTRQGVLRQMTSGVQRRYSPSARPSA